MEEITWEETVWTNRKEFQDDLDNNYLDLINRPKSLICSGNCYEEDKNGNIVKRCALCMHTAWGLDCKLNNI